MKKRIIFLIYLCICFALHACAVTDPINMFEATAGTATFITDSSDKSQISDEYYQYGNMQKNHPSGNFMLLDTEVIFRFLNNGGYKLYTYNLENGQVFPYCKDATCTHQGSCSYGALKGALEVYKGKIYSRNTNLQPVELTENGQRILAPKVTGSAFHNGDNMYVVTRDSTLVVFENGSDKYRVILDEYVGFWNVIFGQYLYANNGVNITRIDLSAEQAKEEVVVSDAVGIIDGQHIYFVNQKNNYLYRCNMDGSEPLLLVEQPVLPASLNFDDEYFYFRLYTDYQLDEGPDTYDIYRFPKNDPAIIEKIATLPEPAFQVFTVPGTGKIFVSTWNRSNGEDNDLYVMNTDGSDLIRLEIPEY